LQTPTVFWIGREIISHLLTVHGDNDVQQTETPTAESSTCEVEMTMEKLKGHKSPSIDQIPAQLIKAECRTIYSINSIWNKEELPEQWKESLIVPIYKKGYKTDCRNYSVISVFTTTYKIVSNILLSRLTPFAEEIIGDHQHGF
jgi:hypothetical protein